MDILKSDKTRLNYLLTPYNIEAIYSKMREVLPADLLSFFTEPILSGYLKWKYSTNETNVLIKSYEDLSDGDKNFVKQELADKIQLIKKYLKNNSQLKKHVNNILTIPEVNSVKLLIAGDKRIVVLTEWGHSLFSSSPTYNPLLFIIEQPVEYAEVIIETVSTNGEILPLKKITINFSRKRYDKKFISDNEGKISLGEIMVGEVLDIYDTENNAFLTKLIIEKEGIYKVVMSEYANLTISVVDHEDKLVPDYSLSIKYIDDTKSYQSDTDGKIILTKLKKGETVEIIDNNDSQNRLKFHLKENKNYLNFKIASVPFGNNISFKVIDNNNNPVPFSEVSIQHNQGVITKTTNENGEFHLSANTFNGDQKLKAVTTVSESGKDKKYKTTIPYKVQKDDYIIKLKKNNYWWLLLLLLPMLLLIPYKKDVVIKVSDINGNIVKNAEVVLKYKKQMIYEANEFFINKAMSLRKNTDSSGIVKFDSLQTSVYSFVFYNLTKMVLYSTEGCYASDTVQKKFHYIWSSDTIKLHLSPILVPLDFKVVDIEDNEPINKSHLEIISKFNKKKYTKSTTTNANGEVVINNIPKCGEIIKVKASAHGYYSDSIMNISVEKALSNNINRLFKLKPIKKRITFFVTNCKTGERLPNAKATIIIKKKNKSSKQQAITNTNGVGKGEYDNLNILYDLYINVEKKYFKPGKLNKTVTVEEFINLPDSARTICLEPLKNSIEFLNIDSLTKKPLAGVTNIIKITNKNKSEIDSIISNHNGKFNVSNIEYGDKITIISKYPPHYKINDYTIKNKDGLKLKKANQDKRTIPLAPRMEKLVFRTIDANDGHLIDNASLKVYINDKLISTPTNSGNGEFIVKAPYYSNISIIASKDGYADNSEKIKDKPVSFLLTSVQQDRDIEMERNCFKFVVRNKCEQTPIPNVNLQLKINGNIINKTSGNNGEIELCGYRQQDIVYVNNIDSRYVVDVGEVNGKQVKYLVKKSPINLKTHLRGQEGKLNFRLIWNTTDDLDLELYDPRGHTLHIHGSNSCACGGKGDVDANAGSKTTNPIENFFYDTPLEGSYIIRVQMHQSRTRNTVNFSIIITEDCNSKTIHGSIKPSQNTPIKIGEYNYRN